MYRTLALTGVALVVTASALVACTGNSGTSATPSTSTGSTVPPPEGGRPNVVVILTNDQRWDSLWALPNVQRTLVKKGTTFENMFVVNPSCCPSRSSILTGLYSHSTGVWRNHAPHGGFESF
ncbi:MAG TPA: sulfatase-like hydrolase/transferase, partial [Actinomycetota bacterium]